MGYAIRRADGTYRAWFRNAQDEPLGAGEIYEEWPTAPAITLPLSLQGRDDVRDAYVVAKAAVQALATDATIPAVVRQAIVRLGLCLEALLIYLNRKVNGA